jgi:hypothetical protein
LLLFDQRNNLIEFFFWLVCRQRLWKKLARLYKGGFLVHWLGLDISVDNP